ncbi:hypothetical protein KCU89_g19471, partial [Aureobasidium melanogenum]
VHLVGNEIKVIRTPEVLGIQGKKKIITKGIGDGAGLGGELKLSFQAYKYAGVESGFAESDLDEYDAAAAGLAWSRSLGVVRKALRIASDIERIRDNQLDYARKGNAQKALSITAPKPAVLHVPTLTGAFHEEDLADFYTEFFQPSPTS